MDVTMYAALRIRFINNSHRMKALPIRSRTGKMVDGRYLLREEIGGGQLSSVYRALDTADDDTPVAVKLLDTQHPDPIKRELFKRETAALKRLQHPNIISLRRSGWSDAEGYFFLVLDYVPYSLDKFLSDELELQSGSFNPYRAMRELAGAVAYAHAQNVIHRDIKPSNVLIDESGRSLLADFGVSKLLDQLTTGETLAKYWSGGYASPEQRASRTARPESDIYSLGAIFYHMLSSQAPPPEGPTPDMVDEITMPIQLRTVLKRMLVEDQKRREYGGNQLVEYLETITRQIESLPKHYLILTNRAINDLQNTGYITDRNSPRDVIKENLGATSQNEVYVQQDLRNEDIWIFGDSLRLICAINDGVLVVKTVHAPHISELDKNRDHAMPYHAIWEPVQKSPHDQDSGSLDSLRAALEAHKMENAAAKEQRRSRREFIQQWLDVLNRKKQDLTKLGLEYKKVEKTQEGLKFTLAKQPPDDLRWAEDSPLAVQKKKKPDEAIGDLIKIQGSSVYVASNQRMPKSDIPETGRLTLDRFQVRSAIDRQIAASFDFLDGRMVNSRMADAVVDPSAATRMPEPTLDFYQDWLSEDKKSAVRRAVASNELFLIQGPPGTGKTAVIAEIVLQILKRNPDARILLSSQSNVAVDHAMAQIHKAMESDLPMTRLGRVEKIGPDGSKWTIGGRTHALHQKVQGECSAIISELKLMERDYRTSATYLPAQAAPTRHDDNGSSDFDGLSQIQSTRAILEEWAEVAGLGPDFERLIVEQSNIVGATCLFSGGKRMPEADFDWAIIDEAGRATLPEALVPMAKAERAILVGDERQLPPMIDDFKQKERGQAPGDDQLDKSLFQSLVEEADSKHTASLSTQYRMHPAIGRLISAVFYNGRIEQGTEDSRRIDGWISKPVTWLSTSRINNHYENREGQSFINHAEARLILRKLEDLERCWQHDKRLTVGVIAGYLAHVGLLFRMVRPDDRKRWRQLQIEIATVDSFQGRECDVIIYSSVRSNQRRQIGFLKDYRRINVALSRARDMLVIVGDDVMMRNATIGPEDNPFSAVLKHIHEHKKECDLINITSKMMKSHE